MSDLDGLLAVVPEGATAGLAIDADLRVELTTAVGTSTTARVTGDGQQVRIEASRPEVLLSAVGRADVGRVAELLAATGVTVSVVGPHGPVATLGAGTSTRIGRAITGSSHVAPAPRGALSLMWATPSVRWGAIGIPVALLVLTAIRRLGRAQR